MTDYGSDEFQVTDEVEAALHRQDEAFALLERLRAEEPTLPAKPALGSGRREVRRWPTPPGVTMERHDGLKWYPLDCVDMAVGGARVTHLDPKLEGPFPVRLRAPGVNATLVLCDIVWRDKKEDKAGLRFDFGDDEARETWSGALIDALLARHSLG